MAKYYIAIDWAQSIMAIAYSSDKNEIPEVLEEPASVKSIKLFLEKLKGEKILTVEESTSAQWLYVELRQHVDTLIICDPYRNSLLKEGAKNDKIDAIKLLKLLRAGLLKPVFHSCDEIIKCRKIVSSYCDLVQSGVRLKNRKKATLRSIGLKSEKEKVPVGYNIEKFILTSLDEQLDLYERQKIEFNQEFSDLRKKHKLIKLIETVPGIGLINGLKVVAHVVDPKRFKTRYHFYSYCGLVKHDLVSGGIKYGSKATRHNKVLKQVFKTAALVTTYRNNGNCFREFFDKKIKEGLSEREARNATARRIACLTLGTLKSGKPFDSSRF